NVGPWGFRWVGQAASRDWFTLRPVLGEVNEVQRVGSAAQEVGYRSEDIHEHLFGQDPRIRIVAGTVIARENPDPVQFILRAMFERRRCNAPAQRLDRR